MLKNDYRLDKTKGCFHRSGGSSAGKNELQALALGVLRVLKGEEKHMNMIWIKSTAYFTNQV